MTRTRNGLIIVDVENDFCPGGSLAVKNGDEVVPEINKVLTFVRKQKWALLAASRDWHPKHTSHFAQDRADGKGWPVHCVQNTRGAEFHPDLNLGDDVEIFSKGMDPSDDGYSALDGIASDGRTLKEALYATRTEVVYVCGLATDYCVLCTVLHALRLGFKVVVMLNAIRAVDLQEGDGERAIEEMKAAGAKVVIFVVPS